MAVLHKKSNAVVCPLILRIYLTFLYYFLYEIYLKMKAFLFLSSSYSLVIVLCLQSLMWIGIVRGTSGMREVALIFNGNQVGILVRYMATNQVMNESCISTRFPHQLYPVSVSKCHISYFYLLFCVPKLNQWEQLGLLLRLTVVPTNGKAASSCPHPSKMLPSSHNPHSFHSQDSIYPLSLVLFLAQGAEEWDFYDGGILISSGKWEYSANGKLLVEESVIPGTKKRRSEEGGYQPLQD